MRPPHDHAAALARLAGLLADPTRAAMCLALLDQRAWTAGELARHTGVAPSTATEHLTRLVQGGLLTQHRQGRHRYLRLADTRTAHLVETLAAHAAPGPGAAPAPTLRRHRADAALARARTCYDHLAGHLGCAVTEAMTRQGLLTQDTGFALTRAGLAWFDEHGIALARGTRRPLARACLDWTERRPHLAGAAGAALCAWVLDSGWCQRVGSGRALRVTGPGRTALARLWDVHLPT
ncbi:helix-turn-helix transcriptional regulator [Nocardiopsis sp. NRRL B-16309]|uniref:ArsR/SmtB family transcription factor n=1 Tax=Nocardiopsis sp. NRRL B-16309 TaxID=1519494 RepID=UPI0006ADEC8B|nr:winged helix-turn-helix domain-containing protein [Nocardiopsis sp. NRRL B-16309]KOX15771.1 ArsR family transcriptional regulator [Nocardiopsis sp. NRRL B-16309]